MLGSLEQKLRLVGGNLGFKAKFEGERKLLTWVDEDEAEVKSRVIVGNKGETGLGKKTCFALDRSKGTRLWLLSSVGPFENDAKLLSAG